MKEIQLTQGKVALVDDGDFERVSQYKWCVHKIRNTFYAVRSVLDDGRQYTLSMHTYIMGKKLGFQIDHINHNGLDNRRLNIRHVTPKQNRWNSRRQCNSASPYKGVHLCKRTNTWTTRIQLNGVDHFLGYYKTPELAALAYNKAAIKYFREYAFINKFT